MALPILADSVRLTDDGVSILDRRVFPAERVWLHCATVEDVARAIEDMVTQSSGPYFAALWGMVLAAREAAGFEPAAARAHLEKAGARLIDTRRTNNHLRKAVHAVVSRVTVGMTGAELVAAALDGARAGDERYRARSAALGTHTANLLPDNGTVLTHCWADLYLVELVRAAQGALRAAETLVEMGVDTTVITDGMGAAVLASGEVAALVTAADRVTMDGSVVNKIGTLGLAVAALAFDVPFHAMVQAPDRLAPTAADVPIEYRDGAEVLNPGAHPGIRGHYPAFDITPPRFVTTVVTDRGPYDPHQLADYYRETL